MWCFYCESGDIEEQISEDGSVVLTCNECCAEMRGVWKKPDMVECRACSIAGAADRAVFHAAPECKE